MAVTEYWKVIDRRRRRIKAFHKAEWTAREMAQELSVSLWTVFNDHKELSIKPHDGRNKRMTARQIEAYDLWVEYKNFSIVGELMNVCKSTARRHVIQYMSKKGVNT